MDLGHPVPAAITHVGLKFGVRGSACEKIGGTFHSTESIFAFARFHYLEVNRTYIYIAIHTVQ
jgi:hypothetical protein